ncbi:ABC transporter ATP-binding protein [Xanthomonas arboricola pv. fragariae]|nr:hypothetical protein XarCFBP6762_05685 [Xanthomonas arboricola]SOT99539.1 ABC transporter ATP-binding protein [Xanthomonas arboricola pv. fragariae]
MKAGSLGRLMRTASYCFAFPFRNMRTARRALVYVFVLHSLVTFSWSFADPFIQRFMIDQLVARNIGMFLAAVLTAFALYIGMYWLGWRTVLLRADVDRVLSALLMDRAMSSLYAHPPRRGSQGGDLVSRVMNEPAQLSGTATFALEMFGIVLTFCFSVIFCAFVSIYAMLPLMLLLPVVIVVVMRDANSAHGASIRVERRKAEATSELTQTLASMSLFVPFRLLGRVRQEVNRSFSRYRWEAREMLAGRALVNRNARMSMSAVEVLIFAAVAFVVIQKDLSIGSYFGLTAAYWRLLNSVRDMAERMPMVAVHYGRIRRYERFCTREPGRWAATARGNEYSQLEVRKLTIGRHDGTTQQLTFDLAPGQRLVVTGANGSGKTTFLNALSCPRNDQIRNLQVPGPMSLVVSPPAFPVLSAARMMKLDLLEQAAVEEIRQLAGELGLDPARFNECPQAWSDGEKRRLGVLLALSKKAAIYVFDEPLSGLESTAKSKIMKTIIDRTRDAILVVTLHEPELVEMFTHHLDMSRNLDDRESGPIELEGSQTPASCVVRIGA